MDVAAPAPPVLAPEDADRAGFYGLIAHLLVAPPPAELLAALAAAAPLEVDEAVGEALALRDAWAHLCAAAHGDATVVHAEWQALFTAVGRPAVLPYASWFLTGFLMEEPLAVLRDDLAALGLARAGGQGEPEDHLAAVCEAMRALIEDVAAPDGWERQRRFFARHLAPWAGRCGEALAGAEGARFYRAAGGFVCAFMALEARLMRFER